VLGFAELIISLCEIITFTKVTMFPSEIWEQIFSNHTVWTLHPLRRVCKSFNIIIKDRFDMTERTAVDRKVLLASLASIVLFQGTLSCKPYIYDEIKDHLWKHRKVSYILQNFKYESNPLRVRICYNHLHLIYKRSASHSKLYGWVGAIQIQSHTKERTGERATNTFLDTFCKEQYRVVHQSGYHITFVESDITNVANFLMNAHTPASDVRHSIEQKDFIGLGIGIS
jgi:hypothetical protein